MKIGSAEDLLAVHTDSDEECPTLFYIGSTAQITALTVLYPDGGDHLLTVVSAILAQRQHDTRQLTVAFTGACLAFRAPSAFHVWYGFWYRLNTLFIIRTLALLRWRLRIEIDLIALGADAARLAQRARRRGFSVYASFDEFVRAHAPAPLGNQALPSSALPRMAPGVLLHSTYGEEEARTPLPLQHGTPVDSGRG
jgi:hypothetical protein